MITRFLPLFTLRVTHTYYNGTCPDFEFIIPSATRRLMARGKILTKVIDNTLHAVFESAEDGSPLADITGNTMRIGVRLANSNFSNFTTLGTDYFDTVHRYFNLPLGVAFTAPLQYTFANSIMSTPITLPARPIDVWLEADPSAGPIAQRSIIDPDATLFNLDFRALPEGPYQAAQSDGDTTPLVPYYYHPELRAQGATAVADVLISNRFYGPPLDLTMAFTAKQEVLKYYVISKGYNDIDFAALGVADTGYTEDARPQVTFTRIESVAFTGSEIPVSLLASGDEKVVLFKSDTSVPRRAAGRKKIQLSKSGDPVIANLPQPGPDKPNADMIIHISKP